MNSEKQTLSTQVLNATVLVTAIGYLIDFYDFIIFNVVRTQSLTDLHLTGDVLTRTGLFISNSQLAGLLIGSWLWGVLGDRYGRKSCLFASILTYSCATIYCSTVQSIDQYAVARFLAGLGVAGELGVGITLISEKLTAQRRGYGVTFFIILGFFGVLAAAFAANQLSWRQAYMLGGVAGLLLLLARIFVFESGLYQEMAAKVTDRGGLRIIFRDRKKLKKYIAAILMLTPTTFIPQIVWTLSPELAKAQGVTEPVKAGSVLAIGYSCVIVGDFFASLLSEKLRSRKQAILVCYILGVLCFLKYILFPSSTLTGFYIINGLLGLTFGIWVVGVALAAEQVGTNVRSTVTTTVPNFARGLAIVMNFIFAQIKPMEGSTIAVGIVGFIIFSLALWGWKNVDETYGKDLNYEEKSTS